MITIYRVIGKVLSASCIVYGLTAVFTPALAGKDSSTFNFTAEFIGGGCEISTSKSQVVFNGGDPILPSDIASSPPTETFDVVLSNCAGVGLTPKITVAGNAIDSYGPSLFRDPSPSSTSVGYGILLSTTGNTSFNANTNLAKNKMITVKNWSAGTELNTIASALPVVATLTCGNCDFAGRQSGDLIANVTFSFVYD